MVGKTLLVAVALLVFASPAGAVDQTYTFDDIQANTVVSNQYAARGLTFGPIVAGQAQVTRALPTVVNVGSTAAQTGDRVGRVVRSCFSLECVGTAETWAQFSAGQARVRVFVGTFGTHTATITLTGYNASGAQVAQDSDTTLAGSFTRQLDLSAASASIRFVRLRSSSIGTFGLDSLFASTTPSSGADFSISASSGPHVVTQGQSVSVPITLTRRNSSGTIRVTATGLPFGVTAAPVEHTLLTRSALASTHQLNLVLTASSNAPPTTGQPITFTATPLVKEAGTGTRSLPGQARVLVFYDLAVEAIEPTQGIQAPVFATRTSATTTNYAGVPLQQAARTIVRVYANTNRGGQPVPFVGMRLFGFRSDGTALPGSPLFADNGSRTAPFNTAPNPTHAERSSATIPFTFTLPPSWTGSGIQQSFSTSLRAELVLPTQGISFRECDGCTGNDKLSLNGLSYVPTCCVTVATTIITGSGGTDPRAIDQILGPWLHVVPLDIDLKPYGTTIEMPDDAIETTQTDDGPVQSFNRAEAIDALLAFNVREGLGEVVLGILASPFSDGFGDPGFGIFDDIDDRPLTSSIHELVHGLGRVHAAKSCGANDSGELWPPDQTGLIGGFALDRSAPSPYRVFSTPAELDVMPSPLPTAQGGGDIRAFYDYMSYCAYAGAVEGVADPNSWISVKGWTDLINRWRGGSLQSRQAAGQLYVTASLAGDGTARILSVRPLTPKQPSAGLTEVPLRLVVRDAGGTLLADVPLAGRTLTDDRGRPPATVLEGLVPVDPALAHTVEITRDGAVLATRTRSAGAPTGEFLSPTRRQLVGRGERLDIRWRAGDPDGDQLETIVEWSAQGGEPGTWRSVFVGPNGGSVELPSEYFGGSNDAFLRLRLNDGFNETLVLSPPFRTVHRGPTVDIVTPRPQSRLRRDAPVVLEAVARDERQQRLTGRSVRWFRGKRPIARGVATQVRLPVGRHRLRAVARDADGRRGADTVRIRVVPAVPSFTRLDVPRRVAPSARRVRLRVAASLPSRLVVRDGPRRTRVRVGARARRIAVRIRRGSAPLRLRLALTADGRTRTVPVEIAR